MERFEIKRDESETGQDFGGWKVIRFWERGTMGGWQVVFRGDFAEAHDFFDEQIAN